MARGDMSRRLTRASLTPIEILTLSYAGVPIDDDKARIKLSLFVSLFYNCLGVPLGFGLFYAATKPMTLPPAVAAIVRSHRTSSYSLCPGLPLCPNKPRHLFGPGDGVVISVGCRVGSRTETVQAEEFREFIHASQQSKLVAGRMPLVLGATVSTRPVPRVTIDNKCGGDDRRRGRANPDCSVLPHGGRRSHCLRLSS